jgi:hypothetical protein
LYRADLLPTQLDQLTPSGLFFFLYQLEFAILNYICSMSMSPPPPITPVVGYHVAWAWALKS